MRLTVRTNLAMRVLMYCAVNRSGLLQSGQVAVACNASAHHVAQVINKLSTKGFLRTHRGRAGGLELAREPRDITVGEVFTQFEGDLPLTECLGESGNTCPLTPACRLRGALIGAVAAFYRALDQITLDELVRDNIDLEAAFSGVACASGGTMARAGAQVVDI
ncbi:MAG: Rrf2 family transcriptional regulator [Paracoccus sp. (in: a-proteobacteria)]|nr:Rrf2 family transcriptional regulator [Paracoccus sp. (in: a-proteobacteria)]